MAVGDLLSGLGSLLGMGDSVLSHLADDKNASPRLIFIPEAGDEYEFELLPEDEIEPAGDGVYATIATPGIMPIYQFMGPGEQTVAFHGLLKGENAYTDYQMFERWKRSGTVFTLVYGAIAKTVAIRNIRWRIRSLSLFWYDMELVEFADTSKVFKPVVTVWPKWAGPSGLWGLLNGILNFMNNLVGTMRAVMGLITGVIDMAAALVDLVAAIGDTFNDLLDMPGELASSLRASIGNVRDSIRNLLDRFDEITEAHGSGGSDPDPAFTSSRPEDVRAVRSFRKIRKNLIDLDLEFAILDKTLAKVEKGEDMNVPAHVVADGETLRDLAVKYYGSAEYWAAIARRNALASLDLFGGQQLAIPKLRTQVKTKFGVMDYGEFWTWFLETRRRCWRKIEARARRRATVPHYWPAPEGETIGSPAGGEREHYTEYPPGMGSYLPGTTIGDFGGGKSAGAPVGGGDVVVG